jgi:hypothetical protein
MKRIPDRVKQSVQQFSGRALASKLDEYSTVYGEVLLGMHREVTSLRAELASHQDEVELRWRQTHGAEAATRARLDEVERRLATLETFLSTSQRMEAGGGNTPLARRGFLLSAAAVVLSVLALGTVWAQWILH